MSQEIINIITTVGFPIAACIAIAWFYYNTNTHYREDIKEMTASHKEEMNQMVEAINNNTLVIQKLVDHLDGKEK